VRLDERHPAGLYVLAEDAAAVVEACRRSGAARAA
jgi:hypothetical protein